MKIFSLLLFLLLLYNNIYSQNPCPGIPTVDYPGKTYNTVTIGDQCWLKENLDVGIMIDSMTEQSNNRIIEKYCYNDKPGNCTTYGGLYLWNEAMQYGTTPGAQGICPPGWHIPTYVELQTLSTTVSNNSIALETVGQGISLGAGTNTSGISALLEGLRNKNGLFQYLGEYAFFWSSTGIDANTTDGLSFYFNVNRIDVSGLNPGNGFSVRCLNDLSVSTLPVELNSFTAIADGRTIRLNWSTQTEKNSDKFDIERKTIDAAWTSIGSVKASVLSNSPKQYSYTDKNLQSGKYQYRLKMIDNDGTFKYSPVVEADVALPKDYELSQNFPNPFNPNTIISYSLPLASNVRFIVYNSLGQTIKVLENGFKNAGSYSVNFSASDLPSGIYYYKIEAEQFSQIKKMILLK